MGLDSVELLVEWEKYFNIQIPDPEAEKILTVQDAVDCVSRHLHILRYETTLQDEVFNRVQTALANIDLKNSYTKDDFFCRKVPVNVEKFWTIFESELKLKVPKPPKDSEDRFFGNKIFTASLREDFKYTEMTFGQLTDVICATNSEKFVNNKNIRSKYEIYIAIMTMTVEKIGIDPYSFRPEKTFTGDFGID